MTATPLIDLVELEGRLAQEGTRRQELLALVQRMITSLVEQSEQLHEYERQIHATPAANEQVELHRDETMYGLFQEWAAEAETLLDRLAAMTALEIDASQSTTLRDELGFARARLKLTPQKLARARAQIRAGQTVPIEVLRNELQARRRG